MSVTELDEVQALLERVLPDPSGYAQRLLLQLMARLGQSTAPDAGALRAFVAPAGFSGAETVMTPGHVADYDDPVDTNILLAAALGACECWGLRADCQLCGGQGSAGWARPDPELFEEFVQPAITRKPRKAAKGRRRPSAAKAPDDNEHQHSVQGESR